MRFILDKPYDNSGIIRVRVQGKNDFHQYLLLPEEAGRLANALLELEKFNQTKPQYCIEVIDWVSVQEAKEFAAYAEETKIPE